jgi:hypothetical protein
MAAVTSHHRNSAAQKAEQQSASDKVGHALYQIKLDRRCADKLKSNGVR